MSKNRVFISPLWERHINSQIAGEVFAELKGIGRFSIRKDRVEQGKFVLKLNGAFLLRSNSIETLKAFAQAKVLDIMRENSGDE